MRKIYSFKKELSFLFGSIGLMVSIQLNAQQVPVLIEKVEHNIGIPEEALFLYEDITASLTLSQVVSKTFKSVSDFPVINNRNHQSIWWTKIKIKNNLPAQQTFWVNIPGKYGVVYIQEEGKPIQEFKTGNLRPKSQKVILFEHKFYNYIPLEIAANSKEITLWAKVTLPELVAAETDIKALMNPFFAQNQYNEHRKQENITNFTFQTALLFLFLYCLIYFINTRASYAKYLMSYCLISSIYFFNMESYLTSIDFIAEHPIIPNYIHLGLINLMVYFDVQIIRHYLNLKVTLPKWDNIFRILLPFSILASIASVICYYFLDNFNLSYGLINGGFNLLYLILRIGFVIQLFFSHQSHRFKMMRIALLIGILFFFIAFSGFFIYPIDGSFFFQLGVTAYILTIIISLSKDAAVYQNESAVAIQKQIAQEKELEIQQRELQIVKQQEELSRIKNEELERIDQMKSHFFANVSHELRTPLTLMLGPIRSALADENISNRNFTFLSLAKNNGNRLLKMINEILDLTKLEAKGLALKPKETLFFPFLKQIVSSYESHAVLEKIQFLFDYQLDKELILNIDAQKLEVILNNLLANALKFTYQAGQIKLIAKETVSGIQMEVSDTGNGIHPDDLPHIFNRFYQSNQQENQAIGGTGIGLALSKEFAELMQGKLWVESDWQKGASFFLEIPMVQVVRGLTTQEYQATQTAINEKEWSDGNRILPKQKIVPISNSKPTILIVEDNADLRDYLETILAPTYQLLLAKHGLEALDKLSDIINQQTNSRSIALPSLIISDMMMPVMDGLKFLQTIKSKDYFRMIPVIMLTARADMSNKLQALRIGVDDYLLKPFIEEELLTRIFNLLENYKNRVTNSEYLESEEGLISEESGTAILEGKVIKSIISMEDNHWLKQVETTIIENLENVYFNLDDLASNLGLSKRQLDRRIKKLMALNIGQYVKEIRYAQAKKLLESRQYASVKMVAYKVGIKDRANFSRQFKTRYGRLPSTYF